MSYGTAKEHGRCVGYVVTVRDGGVCVVCNGEGKGSELLLMGNPATIFETRRRAARAIRNSVRSGKWKATELSISRLAPLQE
jgi:hypothetical protein